MRIVLDTNVLISAFLSTNESSANRALLQSAFARQFKIISSNEIMREFEFVLKLEDMQPKHNHRDANELDAFVMAVNDLCEKFESRKIVPASVARDITDTKFLDLAITSRADFLVTNDRRHLLHLKKIVRTKIVTPHKFLLALKRAEIKILKF